MIAYQTRDRRLTYLWADGRALVLEGSVAEQSELEAALTRPIDDFESLGDDEGSIVDGTITLEPGSERHARAVIRSLGATIVLVDDAE